jgi:hypothetical protein
MIETFECAGQPRNMGGDQGRAQAPAIRRAIEAAHLPVRRSRLPGLRPFVTGPTRGAGDGRELIRHFTHLSERIDGMARFADVDVDSLFELHLRTAAGAGGARSLVAPATVVAGIGLGGAAGVGMMRGLPDAGQAEPDRYCLRRSRPEVGFGSLEVTLPWLASSIAGVNEAGVAVALSPLRARPRGLGASAPSHLLVQECLQRFEDVDGCIDWCLKRPVLGDVTLVLADARGETATIDIVGRERTVDRREKGPLGADANGPLEAAGTEDATTGLGAGARGLLIGLDCEARGLDLRRIGDESERLVLSCLD